MKSVVVSPFAALIALALWPTPQAFAQAFGEPPPQVRAFRNPEVERAASERPTSVVPWHSMKPFGRSRKSSPRRMPRPAARITAVETVMVKFLLIL